jgi:SAM-dependent methyltransferase
VNDPSLSGTVPYGTDNDVVRNGTVRAGYEAAADDWDAGPGPIYEPLARALVAAAPVPLTGRVILDLGAGTGAAGRAALAAGARQVVAADLSIAMLRRHALKAPGAPACYPVAADAAALPFRDASFDLVLAAFCLNHLPHLAPALANLHRVSSALAASTFAPGWTHPAKDAVDETARSFGYHPPPWYTTLAPGTRAGDPDELTAAAATAGFTRVQTTVITVAVPLITPADLAAWRLGLAHYAPFLRTLDAQRRAEVQRAAEQAVAATGATGLLTVEMTVLTAS